MCAVLKAFRVLVVTLSLVSCSFSPRSRNTLDGHVVIGVVLVFTTLTQCQIEISTFVLVVRLSSVIVDFIYIQIIAHLHRENGSFEVLSLHPPSVTVDRRQL